jgi:chromosome segregation ATPase
LVRAIVFLAVFVVGLLIGHAIHYHDVTTREAAIQQLQKTDQQLETTINQQNTDLISLRNQVASLKAKLEAIMPSENTYNIDPNHAIMVADGRLTVGWVGLPTVDGITININGTPQPVAVGDIIRVSPDADTACEVRLQSFDIKLARFTASCTTKPK